MAEKFPKFEKKETSKEMPSDWERIRKRVLLEVPNRKEGLNTERVEKFITQLGLLVDDYILFYPDDFKKIRKILYPYISFSSQVRDLLRYKEYKDFFKRRGEYSPKNKESESFGIHNKLLNLTLIERKDNILPIYNEKVLVHELAHASNKHRLYVGAKGETYVPRQGFQLSNQKWGNFLEEGFAGMIDAEYVEKNMPSNIREKILEAQKYDKGFSLSSVAEGKSENTGKEFIIPLKHLIINSENILTTMSSSLPAFGLELLCMKNEKLKKALVDSRSDIEGLREVAKIINQIKPGLYLKLQKLSGPNFDEEGINLIINEVYGGKLKLNERKEIVE